MPGETTFIQLRWEEPDTGQVQEPVLKVPLVVGRETDQMPDQWGGLPVSKLELPHKQVSHFHALITVDNQQLYITDKSANGTFLNGRLIQQDGQRLSSKDTLRIGPYKITAAIAREGMTNSTELNFDQSHMAIAKSSEGKNAVLIWLAGIVILVLMGFGTWKLTTFLLEQSRPQPEASLVRDGWRG